MAFGGGAADALFGAGSGNVLTKVTKYATVIFFILALFLGYLQDRLHSSNSVAAFEKQLEQKQSQMPVSGMPAPAAQPTQLRRLPRRRGAGKQSAGGAPSLRQPMPRRRRRNRSNAMAIFQRAWRIFSRARFAFCLMAGLWFRAVSATSRRPTSPSSTTASRKRSTRLF